MLSSDLRTLFLKSRIAEPDNFQTTTTTQPSVSPQPAPAPQSYPAQSFLTTTPAQQQVHSSSPTGPVSNPPLDSEEDDHLNVMHQKLVESFLVKGVAGMSLSLLYTRIIVF